MIKIGIDKEVGRSLPVTVPKLFPADRIFMHELASGRTNVYYERVRDEPALLYESPSDIDTILATSAEGLFVLFAPGDLNGVNVSGEITKVALPIARTNVEPTAGTYNFKVFFESLRNEANRSIYLTNDSIDTMLATAVPDIHNITTGSPTAATADRVINFGGFDLTFQELASYTQTNSAGQNVMRSDERGNIVYGAANIAAFNWANTNMSNVVIMPGATLTAVGTETVQVSNLVVEPGGTVDWTGSTLGQIENVRVKSGNTLNLQNTEGSVTDVRVGAGSNVDISGTTVLGEWDGLYVENCIFKCPGNSVTKENITIKDRDSVTMGAAVAESDLKVLGKTSNKIVFVDASPANITTVDSIEALDLHTLIGEQLTYIGEVFMFNMTAADLIQGFTVSDGIDNYAPSDGTQILFTNGSNVQIVIGDSGATTSGVVSLPFVNFNRANLNMDGDAAGFGDEFLYELYTAGVMIQRQERHF